MEWFRRAQFYREQAEDCRAQARAIATIVEVREHWLKLAEQYDNLAAQALKLSAVKNEALS